VAFFYIATAMRIKQILFQLFILLFFTGCVSDNSKKTVEKEKVNQTQGANQTQEQIAENKQLVKNDSLNKNVNSDSGSLNQNNKNKKPAGKKAILNNTTFSVDERMDALQKFDKNITKPDEYQLLKKIVQNPNEHLRLREAALKKIYQKSGEDEDMLQYLFSVIRGRKDSFKPAVLYALKTMSFSSQLLHKKRAAHLQAMRSGLLTTLNPEAYRQIIKDLADANDPRAAEALINSLKIDDFSKLKPKDMFPILKQNKRPELYPGLQAVLLKTKNTEVKEGLLPLLSEYPPSKATIVKILDDTTENVKVRLKAAEVIAETDKTQYYNYTKSIIFDETDNIKLRRFCLKQLEKFDFKIIAKYRSLRKDLENFAATDAKLIKSTVKILNRF